MSDYIEKQKECQRNQKKDVAPTEFDIEGKLVESIKIQELGDIAQEWSELGLDSVMNEGLARDVPIVRTIVAFAKIAGSIKDLLYLKKIKLFLKKIAETTPQERERFVEENCKDSKRFEEAVLLILDQADDMEKATLIGKIFKACILGKITYVNALTLSSMVNKAIWADIEEVLKGGYTTEVAMRLCNCGLLFLHWKTRFHSEDESQSGYFDGFSHGENEYTKMLKEAAKL